MYSATDLKSGMTINYGENIYTVLSCEPASTGKRSAVYKGKLKNLRTGSITEETFNSEEKIQPAHIVKKKMKFYYTTGDVYIFNSQVDGASLDDYEEIELSEEQVKDEKKYLKPDLVVLISSFEDELLGIELPEKVSYKITETEPAIKGNTATNATKDAIIETGLLVRVPLFINIGEEIIISTKDGKYVSRK